MATKPDHLDREISVSAEVTPTGIKAAAKSRLISAIDRLGGNLADALNIRLEESTELRRLRLDAETKVVEAAVRSVVKRIRTDSSFAEKALTEHLGRAFRNQQNREAVGEVALEDLREQPPTEEQANSGPPILAEEFTDRFGRFAEGANSEALRQKWGRVLAAEIRQPGTVTNRVMRVVDELDPETALLFERTCEHRIADGLPPVLLGELNFDQQSLLVQSGLIADSGTGVVKRFRRTALRNGTEIWICGLGDRALVIPAAHWHGQAPGILDGATALVTDDSAPALPVEIVTPVGLAVAAILPDRQDAALARLLLEVRKTVPEAEAYQRVVGSEGMRPYNPAG